MMQTWIRLGLCVVLSIGSSTWARAADKPSDQTLSVMPEALSKSCRNGRAKLYDECSDQMALFEAAAKRAADEGKILLVSYGAEWCIWCHVFDAYIRGKAKTFTYTYGSPNEPDTRETSSMQERAKADPTADAQALKAFVAKSFVVVHIDARYAPSGDGVLHRTGATAHYPNWIPFVFAVDGSGKYAGTFSHQDVEVRRDGMTDWFRGYDRIRLQAALERMRAAALVPR